MSDAHLLSETPADGVVLLTINRPAARNAITTALQRELDATLRRLNDDDAVRAIVVTGAGETAFSAGYDVKEFEAFDEDQMLVNYIERQQLIGAVAAYPKPLIGAVNGLAHGGGAILATLFDIRVGGARCDFRFTAVNYGGVNNTWQLPHLVGLAKSLEFTMSGRRIGAIEALHAGLLNHLVDDGEVLSRSVEIATQIAANPPAAVRWHKALIRANVARSLADAYNAENALMNSEMRPVKPAKVFESFLAEHPRREGGET